jgi:hypothetical protein
MLAAIGYGGKRSKAEFHYSYRTRELAEKQIKEYFDGLTASAKAKAEYRQARKDKTTDPNNPSLTETAQLVREALAQGFPKTKFSVRSDSYSMGCAIRVHWTDGPTTNQVDTILNRFERCGFDGMQDLKTYNGPYYLYEEERKRRSRSAAAIWFFIIAVILAVLIGTEIANGQGVPTTIKATPEGFYHIKPIKQPRTDRTFKALLFADAGLTIADIATSRAIQSKPGGYEQNPVFGRHPSTARMTLEMAGFTVMWDLAAWKVYRLGHPKIARIMLAGSVAQETYCVAHNASFLSRH